MIIQYIEDDKLLSQLNREMAESLDKRGDTINSAESYEEAAKQMKNNPPDIVVSDFNYPGMAGPDCKDINGGIAAYAYVVKHLPETPFFFVTSEPAEYVQAQLAQYGLPAIPADRIFNKRISLIKIVEGAASLAPRRVPLASQGQFPTSKPA